MNMIWKGKLAVLLLAAVLSACGVSVEAPPGRKVAPGTLLSGTWKATVALPDAPPRTLTVKPAGDQLSVQWNATGEATGTAALFEFGGKQYLALNDNPPADGFFIVRIESQSNTRVNLRALDGERAAQLLKEMTLPVVYRDQWLHKELFLDKATLQALLEQHPDTVFANGLAITLDKVP